VLKIVENLVGRVSIVHLMMPYDVLNIWD